MDSRLEKMRNALNLKPSTKKKSKDETTSKINRKEIEHELNKLEGTYCPTDEEKYHLLLKRDNLLAKLRKKSTDLKKAKKLSATCQDMCPEKERYTRQIGNLLHSYECNPDGTINHAFAVKDYSRSAADQELPLPSELRPPDVLRKTMDYLILKTLPEMSRSDLVKWYDFFWSRSRSIRKEITQQMLNDKTAVSLVEKCARFHIYASFCMSTFGTKEFDARMNLENLSKCLQTLRHLYDDLACKSIFCESEAEFRAYDILMNLGDSNVLNLMHTYRPKIRNSKECKLAAKLVCFFQTDNYVAFFRLIREKATYLQACLCRSFFNRIRSKAFHLMIKVFRQTSIPVLKFTELLAFDNEHDTLSFMKVLDLQVDESGAIKTGTNYQAQNEVVDEKTNCGCQVIENKLDVSLSRLISGGHCSKPKFPLPSSSFVFDYYGKPPPTFNLLSKTRKSAPIHKSSSNQESRRETFGGNLTESKHLDSSKGRSDQKLKQSKESSSFKTSKTEKIEKQRLNSPVKETSFGKKSQIKNVAQSRQSFNQSRETPSFTANTRKDSSTFSQPPVLNVTPRVPSSSFAGASTGMRTPFMQQPLKPTTLAERLKKIACVPSNKEIWVEVKTAEGRPYFYHSISKESVWKVPFNAVVLSQFEFQSYFEQAQREEKQEKQRNQQQTPVFSNAYFSPGPFAANSSNALPLVSNWQNPAISDPRNYYLNTLAKERTLDNPNMSRNQFGATGSTTSNVFNAQQRSMFQTNPYANFQTPAFHQSTLNTDLFTNGIPVPNSPWHIVWTPDQNVYFYNSLTKASVWDRPFELFNRPDVDLMLSKPPDSNKGNISGVKRTFFANEEEENSEPFSKQRRNENKGTNVAEQAERRKDAFNEFHGLLEEASLNGISRFDSFIQKYENDPRFKAIGNMQDKRNMFFEFINKQCEKISHSNYSGSESQNAEGLFRFILRDLIRNPNILWHEAYKILSSDPRNDKCSVLKKRQKERLFSEHIINLRMYE